MWIITKKKKKRAAVTLAQVWHNLGKESQLPVCRAGSSSLLLLMAGFETDVQIGVFAIKQCTALGHDSPTDFDAFRCRLPLRFTYVIKMNI